MKRNLSFFRVEWNGRKWYATCCDYGPYSSVEDAMSEAERLNKLNASTRKEQNRVVVEWRTRRIQ